MYKIHLEEFAGIALGRGLATRAELDAFAARWLEGFENGEDGFGDETTLDDWVRGLKAWRCLCDLLEANGLRRDARIDWTNVQFCLKRTH